MPVIGVTAVFVALFVGWLLLGVATSMVVGPSLRQAGEAFPVAPEAMPATVPARRRRRAGLVAGAVTVLGLSVASTGMAAAGALPDRAQAVASGVLARVGLDVPTPIPTAAAPEASADRDRAAADSAEPAADQPPAPSSNREVSRTESSVREVTTTGPMATMTETSTETSTTSSGQSSSQSVTVTQVEGDVAGPDGDAPADTPPPTVDVGPPTPTDPVVPVDPVPPVVDEPVTDPGEVPPLPLDPPVGVDPSPLDPFGPGIDVPEPDGPDPSSLLD